MRQRTIYDAFGGSHVENVRKCEGMYINLKTGEKRYLLDKCRGWKQVTFYGNME